MAKSKTRKGPKVAARRKGALERLEEKFKDQNNIKAKEGKDFTYYQWKEFEKGQDRRVKEMDILRHRI